VPADTVRHHQIGESAHRPFNRQRVGAVGLAPILVYWVARLIGRVFRSKRADRETGSRPAGNEGEEPAERLIKKLVVDQEQDLLVALE
jgi:hypothetical protein